MVEPMPTKKSEERYPSFSLWDPGAVQAVFGKVKPEVGETYDMEVRIKVKSARENEKGVSDLELEIVAAGTPTNSEGGEGEDEEES